MPCDSLIIIQHSEMGPAGKIVLRLADERNTADIVNVFRRARTESLPFLPVLHTLKETLTWFRHHEFSRSMIWVAEVGEQIVGFAARESDWLHHLYVLPEHQGTGAGSQLLAKAKEECPGTLRLYTFQQNHRARAFYESRGFTDVEFNEAGGEEQLPDVLMAWCVSGGRLNRAASSTLDLRCCYSAGLTAPLEVAETPSSTGAPSAMSVPELPPSDW